jgi:hypothetical protein
MEKFFEYGKIALKVIVILFALAGLYQGFLALQYKMVRNKVLGIEAQRTYDPDLLYYTEGGEPLVLVKPGNSRTIFFMEGFRTQSPAGMYREWFEKIHKEQNVNIIVPVYGLQSSPFDLRNRDWHYQEDMRTVLQIYNAYTATLPASHRIVTVSQSFGTLPHATILGKANRAPNKAFFLSPLNTGMEFKASGAVVYWLSKQTSWLRHIVLFSFAAPAPGRASVWDIVNKETNLRMAARNDINPEDSSEYGYRSELTAQYLENTLLPQIGKKNITVVWGDSDLYFGQYGFTNFAKKLEESGNTVSTLTLKNSGHMVLLDNGAEKLKETLVDAIRSP